MIYINSVVLESSMLHAKFLRNQSTGSGEENFRRVYTIYEGDSKSSRKSAAKFVIVMGNLRSLCILLINI